jgi:hypothetical protein
MNIKVDDYKYHGESLSHCIEKPISIASQTSTRHISQALSGNKVP